MHVDASVLVAILVNEVDRDEFVEKIATADHLQTSIVSAFEAVIAVGGKLGDREASVQIVRDFLNRSRIAIPDCGDMLLEGLAAVHLAYGKGSGHPARLNMGDCFSYAMAKREGMPLLYKGNDFAQTDLG